MVIFIKTAFKHGITKEQIDDVLRSSYSEAFDEGFDKTGNYSVMYVGFDSQGILLEIRVKFVHVSNIKEEFYVFHASKATKKYQQMFNSRK